MSDHRVMLITGTSKGIGFALASYYCQKGWKVFGCSRSKSPLEHPDYMHTELDITDEIQAKALFSVIRKSFGKLDALINNAGIASMNHALLTPLTTASKIMDTNFLGTFLFCREAARLMQKKHFGRIINFSTVALPFKLEGDAIYASSKAAVVTLTQILAKELASFGITVNAIGPTPVKTDLIRAVPEEKIQHLLAQQAIHRFGEIQDITNTIDFFLKPESDFITGQVLYLGGVS